MSAHTRKLHLEILHSHYLKHGLAALWPPVLLPGLHEDLLQSRHVTAVQFVHLGLRVGDGISGLTRGPYKISILNYITNAGS